MRDPKRISNFCVELGCIWQENFPDWRFGQVMSNFERWLKEIKNVDIFFLEEDEFMALFREFVKK